MNSPQLEVISITSPFLFPLPSKHISFLLLLLSSKSSLHFLQIVYSKYAWDHNGRNERENENSYANVNVDENVSAQRVFDVGLATSYSTNSLSSVSEFSSLSGYVSPLFFE
jgi:hypothetical protein